MGILQLLLKLFGLGDKFKIENIIKSVILGGGKKDGAAASGAGSGPSIGLGLDKLKDMFKSKGMGDILASWIGKGKNQPVTGSQIKGLFSQDELSKLSAESKMPVDKLCEKLAKYLPGVVDKLTPDGKVPGT